MHLTTYTPGKGKNVRSHDTPYRALIGTSHLQAAYCTHCQG